MKIPEKLTVTIVANEGGDLSGIIVELLVFAGERNPYRLYFPKTDESGVAKMTREDFVGQFKDHWEAGLMDHNGTPETAEPIVRVALYEPAWSIQNPQLAKAWPLLTHERTKWSSREEEYRARVSSRNGDFEVSAIEVNLEETPDIVLPVTKKSTVAS